MSDQQEYSDDECVQKVFQDPITIFGYVKSGKPSPESYCELLEGMNIAFFNAKMAIQSNNFSDEQKSKVLQQLLLFLVTTMSYKERIEDSKAESVVPSTHPQQEEETEMVNVFDKCNNMGQLAAAIRSEFKIEPREGSLDDIIGFENIKRDLQKELIDKLKCKALYDKREFSYFGLSFGAPGMAKTEIGHAVANELKEEVEDRVYEVGSEFFTSSWSGQSGKNVNAFFRAIREKTPSLVILDEVDGILNENQSSKRGGDDGGKTVFLREMDPRKKENKGVIIFASTNHPDGLRVGFHRRFHGIFYHPLPSVKVSHQSKMLL